MSNFYDGLGQGMALGNNRPRAEYQANVNGLTALRDALVSALREVAPDHPLLNKDERNKIFDKHSKS